MGGTHLLLIIVLVDNADEANPRRDFNQTPRPLSLMMMTKAKEQTTVDRAMQ